MTERQVSRNHRERTGAPLNPSRAAGPYFHVGDYSSRARCIFTRIRRRRCMTYDRAKGLGGTARYFRPSKMPFIHHTALTLTRRGANTFTYRCREEGWRGRGVQRVSCIQCRVCTVRERSAGGEVGHEGSREEIAEQARDL